MFVLLPLKEIEHGLLPMLPIFKESNKEQGEVGQMKKNKKNRDDNVLSGRIPIAKNKEMMI